MIGLLFAAGGIQDFWFAVPLILAVSLVYAATRHEDLGPILGHAARIGAWIVGFMAAIFVLLLFVTWLDR
jgi:hypothetical protein